MPRCEGWTRTGGVFSLGPPTWSQCPNDAVVLLEVEQNDGGKVSTTKQPACMNCWKEAQSWPIKILSATPISENAEQSVQDNRQQIADLLRNSPCDPDGKM